MLFALCFVMADVIAIVAYIYAIVFICGRWHHTEYMGGNSICHHGNDISQLSMWL